MKEALRDIISLSGFKTAFENMKKVDAKSANEIEQSLIKATFETHKRIQNSGSDRKRLLNSLYREWIEIEGVTSHYKRINEDIAVREGKLWKHAFVATELFFDSVESGLKDFFESKQQIILHNLKEKHTWYEDIADGGKSVWAALFGSDEAKNSATLVGEIISHDLASDVIKEELKRCFEKGNKAYKSKWEEEIKTQTLGLARAEHDYFGLNVLARPPEYNPSAAELTGFVGLTAAVVGSAGLAAGWHTLTYALLNVFPPIAFFALIATAGLALWNEDEALKKREGQVKKTIADIHRSILLQIDLIPIEELENKSVRQAMRELSEDIVQKTSKEWRKAILGGLDNSHFEELSEAAKVHLNTIKQCTAKLDDDIPEDHMRHLNKKDFTLACNEAIFSLEQQKFLKTYGAWLKALANKDIKPITPEQEKFVLTANGEAEPVTDHEKTWWRYQERCKLEAKGEY